MWAQAGESPFYVQVLCPRRVRWAFSVETLKIPQKGAAQPLFRLLRQLGETLGV